MVKKRLTDLLQEETQKFTPSPGESAIEVTAEKVIETDIAESEENPVQTPSANSTKSKTPTKADLEATIKNLQTSLEKSQNQETSLQQEITELKTALSEQKSLSEKLGKELYETKKTALKLAESNSKLIEEINELKNQAAKEAVQEPVKETVKESVQQPKKEQVKETSKSITVQQHKSYKTPTIITTKTNQTKDDFTDKTWLLD